MPDFVKQSNEQFATQLENHHTGLATHGPALGFTPAEINVALNDSKYMRHIVTQQQQALGFSQGFTKFIKYMRTSTDVATMPVFTVPGVVPAAVLVGIETRFRKRAEKAKAVTGVYNNDIGEQLRIVAPNASEELGVPEFEIVMTAGHPVIKWPKKTSDGIEVWKDKGQGFYHAGNDTKSPWIDKDDLPAAGQSAVWKFKIIYLIDDEPVGDYSAVIEVSVKGI
jgi:hypothetical protein